MDLTGETGSYSIAAVSKLTGIGRHALRAWERRYRFPIPHRSSSGHRRYSTEQVHVLLRVTGAVRQGEAIGAAIARLRTEALELADPANTSSVPELVPHPHASKIVDQLVAGDLDAAVATYVEVAADLDADLELFEIIEPALIEVGERWFRGDIEIYQAQFASTFLRSKLLVLFGIVQAANRLPAGIVIVGALQGEHHEGGMMIVSTRLELAGWRTLGIGVDLPICELQNAVARWNPAAVCVSFPLSRNSNKRFQDLASVTGVPIFIGGRSILNYQGMARRHGFHPLVGTSRECVAQLVAALDRACSDAVT